MIEEDFILQECYIDEQMALQAQNHLLWKFNLFCTRLADHPLKLESAVFTRITVLGITYVRFTGKVSGRAEDVAAMMVGGMIA